MFVPQALMSGGEQATLEGLLAMVAPSVSLEIGTHTGGSLVRIARASEEVHTFDLEDLVAEPLPNVIYHLGDSAHEVPRVLAELARRDLVPELWVAPLEDRELRERLHRRMHLV